MAPKRNYKKPWKKNYKKNKGTFKADARTKRKAPTAKASSGTAFSDALAQTPLLPSSKLIHNQLWYTSGIFLQGGLGSIPQKWYVANGLYDPDAALGGHQPIGQSIMMKLYEHYAVIRAKITVNFVNESAAAMRVAVFLTPDATSISDVRTIMENGLIKTLIVRENLSTNTGQLTLEVDIAKYFGKRNYKDVIDDAELRGDAVNNPLEKVYFCIAAFDAFGVGEDVNVGFDAMISYDSIFTEPRKLPYTE